MKEALSSFLILILIYIGVSVAILRSRFKSQFQGQTWECSLVRLASFVLWWLIVIQTSWFWSPVWWVGLATLILIIFFELAMIGINNTDKIAGYWSVFGFILIIANTIVVGSLMQPLLVSGVSSSVFWQLFFAFILFTALNGFTSAFINFFSLLTPLLTMRARDKISSGMRQRFVLFLILFPIVIILISKSQFNPQIWRNPTVLFVVSLGWGPILILMGNRQMNRTTRFSLAPNILALIFVLYFLIRDQIFTSLPPNQLPPVSVSTILLSTLVWGGWSIVDNIILQAKTQSISSVVGAGTRMQSIGKKIEEVRDSQQRDRLLAQYAASIQSQSQISSQMSAYNLTAVALSTSLISQIDDLERSTDLTLEQQSVEQMLESITDGLRILDSLNVFVDKDKLQLPGDLPSREYLGAQLVEVRKVSNSGVTEALLNKYEDIRAEYEKLKELDEGMKTLQLSNDILNRFPREKVNIETLFAISNQLKIDNQQVRECLKGFHEYRRIYMGTGNLVFEMKVNSANRLNLSWNKLQEALKGLREEILEKNHEWLSQGSSGICFYVPKTIKQNETYQMVIISYSEYPKKKVSVEFESGLIQVGKNSIELNVPSSGYNVQTYNVWSTSGGIGSIQIKVDEVRSGPIEVRVLQDFNQILENASKPIALVIPVLVISLFFFFRVPLETATVISGALGGIIIVGLLLRYYLSSRKGRSLRRTASTEQNVMYSDMSEVPQEEDSPVSMATNPPPPLLRCAGCGAQLKTDLSKFCSACGRPVSNHTT